MLDIETFGGPREGSWRSGHRWKGIWGRSRRSIAVATGTWHRQCRYYS